MGPESEALRVIWSTTYGFCGWERGRALLLWLQIDREAELGQAPRTAGFALGQGSVCEMGTLQCAFG